ncbi:hypothetical protein HXX76_008833 [Chlamydomonas incerta]|uniref:inorganic diphosphatase n=1 Tax=Chlamydomonas incerta TaxID=51695 RepID=A0A835SST1_CHLIN|nr:hypothetical protein HXX76_008833 [Chlamydomonas incerta]|eukprot:KAG2432488.1 hypothetical protein HXX76_008833 [Chlamydomonas incerta]
MWVRPRHARAATAAAPAPAAGREALPPAAPAPAQAAAMGLGHASAAAAAALTLRQVRRQGYARARPALRAAMLLLAGLAATALPVLALGAASAAAAAAAAAVGAAAPSAAAVAMPAGAGSSTSANVGAPGGRNSSSSNATTTQTASLAAAAVAAGAVTSYVKLPPSAPELTQPPDPVVWQVYGGCVPRVQTPGAPGAAPGSPGFAVFCVAPAAAAGADVEGTSADGGFRAGRAAGGSGRGRNVSFWHDVPLGLRRRRASSSSSSSNTSTGLAGAQGAGEEVTFWVTNEIPRGTNAKIETQTSLPYTPMMQSTMREQRRPGGPSPTPEQLRFYRVGPSLVNYGGIPQTWEASDAPDPVTGLPADNDPLDYLEVGGAVLPVGGVVRVRLLGALTMVDDNQTDWKMLVLNVKVRLVRLDPAGWREMAEGKPPVTFFLPATNTTTAAAADWAGAFVGREAAAAVLARKHADWRRLLAGGCSAEDCAPLTAAVAAEYGPGWRELGLGQRLAGGTKSSRRGPASRDGKAVAAAATAGSGVGAPVPAPEAVRK